MVNLEYVIKSDCKPTAISLFFRGQHGSIIPDPCPWAFSYNWHQILFCQRYLFSLASRQQLASVWEVKSQSHRFPSLNVSRDRSPDLYHRGHSLVTCCQCSPKVQSGISWSGCSISTCPASPGCHMGGNPQAMVRAGCVVQLHQPPSHLPVFSSPLHLLTARCAYQQSKFRTAVFPKFLREGK